jgi:hypothetical protein
MVTAQDIAILVERPMVRDAITRNAMTMDPKTLTPAVPEVREEKPDLREQREEREMKVPRSLQLLLQRQKQKLRLLNL